MKGYDPRLGADFNKAKVVKRQMTWDSKPGGEKETVLRNRVDTYHTAM